MIPSTIQCVEDFPLTPSGKIRSESLTICIQARENIKSQSLYHLIHIHEKTLQQIWERYGQKKAGEHEYRRWLLSQSGGHSLLTRYNSSTGVSTITCQNYVKMYTNIETIQPVLRILTKLRDHLAHKNLIERVPSKPYILYLTNAQNDFCFLYSTTSGISYVWYPDNKCI